MSSAEVKKPPLRLHVDYDQLAASYDQRYELISPPRGIGKALCDLARQTHSHTVLEVGCGTGHWLAELERIGCSGFGLDRSSGMLSKARGKLASLRLVKGDSAALPFCAESFDLICCVNALHHFDLPIAFIAEAFRTLRAGGALAIVSKNQHAGRERWYLYDYFPGTLDRDLDRYASTGAQIDWMDRAGFDPLEARIADRVDTTLVGEQVFGDPALSKSGTSQLAILDDGEYAAGIDRIRAAIAAANREGRKVEFPIRITFEMVIGRKPQLP